jgi:hypothetical protein
MVDTADWLQPLLAFIQSILGVRIHDAHLLNSCVQDLRYLPRLLPTEPIARWKYARLEVAEFEELVLLSLVLGLRSAFAKVLGHFVVAVVAT